jgi:hypothetical protein
MTNKILTLVLALAIIQTGCNVNTNSDKVTENLLKEDADTSKINEQAEFQFDLTIANIPAPYRILEEVQKSGITFNKDLLNPVSKAETYTTDRQKALNFGVYGVDLGYLAIYNQNQEVIEYFNATRNIAKEVGAGPHFDEIAGSIQLDKSLGDPDQVLTLIDKAYSASDSYLKSNKRLISATNMLLGGWIESQYIACNALKGKKKEKKNAELFNKLTDQKNAGESILKLLEDLKAEEGMGDLHEKVKGLMEIYRDVNLEKGLNGEQVKKLADKLSEIREFITK